MLQLPRFGTSCTVVCATVFKFLGVLCLSVPCRQVRLSPPCQAITELRLGSSARLHLTPLDLEAIARLHSLQVLQLVYSITAGGYRL